MSNVRLLAAKARINGSSESTVTARALEAVASTRKESDAASFDEHRGAGTAIEIDGPSLIVAGTERFPTVAQRGSVGTDSTGVVDPSSDLLGSSTTKA
jgi:hypothetical protein